MKPLVTLPMARPAPEDAGRFCLPSVEQSFVIGSISSPVGPVPLVGGRLGWQDRLGHWRVRWNIGRDRFRIEPGLYGMGRPDRESPVVVTANYKLSFDRVRQALTGRNVWILVLETRGINVWCAAGKGTFGTGELLDRIEASRLDRVVSHRRLLVPQLGATGVAAHEVRKYSGFHVVYGPVSAEDLPRFLDSGWQATAEMRTKRFPFFERLVLVPVELMQGLQKGIVLAGIFLLVGGLAGQGSFLNAALELGGIPALAVLTGVAAGTVLTPLLLPWLPGRAFSIKGLFAGLIPGFFQGTWLAATGQPPLRLLSSFLITLALGSWFGMAFTGASTYTSPNGVRREMLRAIPWQWGALLFGVGLWLWSLF